MSKSTLFRVATAVVAPVLALVAVEAALAVLGYRTTYQKEDPFLGFQQVTSLFEETGSGTYRTRESRLRWFNEQQFDADKPEDGYRIFTFGGSTTFGRPYGHETSFSNWLQALLDASGSSTRYEVVNVGGVSYASYRIVNLMNEMVEYDPDLFIVFTGHNEFLEERTYSEILDERETVTRLRRLLHRSRVYTLLRDLWRGLGGVDRGSADGTRVSAQPQEVEVGQREEGETRFQMADEVTAILDQSYGLDHYQRDRQWRRSVLKHFRVNLDRMVDVARAADVRLVFVVPPSNEKDFSPFKSQVCDSLDGAEHSRWRQLYDLGRSELEDGDLAVARKALARARQIDSCHAGLQYHLGEAALGLGRHDEAKRDFVRARDIDVAPLRATSRIQESVREAARPEHVALVDLVRILERQSRERSGHDILGDEAFLDHVHPRIGVHQELAELLFRKATERGWLDPDRPLERIETSALYDSVMGGLDESYRASRDLNLAKVLTWLGKTEEAAGFIERAAEALPDHPEAQYLRGTLFQHRGEYAQAADAYRRAVRLDSTFARAYNALGGVHEITGRLEEAVAAVRQAIEHQPESDHAHFNLGNALRKAGRTEEAIEAYRRAVELNPGHSQAWNNLAGVYMTEERYEEAVDALDRTLELDPQNVNAYRNLGVIHYRRGEPARAREMFETVIDIRPGDTFARRWLELLDQEAEQ